MPPKVALTAFVLLISGMFLLNRDRKAKTSVALWIPVMWLLIAGSRAVSQWMAVMGLAAPAPADLSSQYMDGSPLDRNVFIALLALGLIALIARRQQVIALLKANGAILIFFLYCGLSVLWSDYTDVSFKRWIKALGDLVMILIVLTESERMAAIKRVLSRVGFLVIPLSVLFIKYYPELGREYRPDFGFWKLSYTGITTSKNSLGMVTLVFGIGCAWQFLQAFKKRGTKDWQRPVIAQGILLAMVAWLFWIINSATSMSCFVMATGLMVVTSFRVTQRRPAIVHVLVFTMIAVSLFALFLDTGGSLVGALGRNPTLTGRTAIWDLTLGMVDNPMVGTGFESFWLGQRLQKMWDVYWWHPNEAHNGYLEIYLTLGWVGVTVLAVLLFSGYRSIANSFRRDPGLSGLRIALFLIAVVYNLTESAIRMGNPIWIFLLMAMAAGSKVNALERDRRVASTSSERLRDEQLIGTVAYEEVV